MPIRVASKRKGSKLGLRPGETAVEVDRRTVLGNPFILFDETDRESVCDCFADWFPRKYAKTPAVRAEVKRIADMHRAGQQVALMCWCAPRRCHADFLKKFIEQGVESGEL